MAKLTPIAGAFVIVCILWPHAGHAAPDEVAALRAEIEALKTDYASRVQALEARIQQLERAVGAAPGTPPGAGTGTPATGPSAAGVVSVDHTAGVTCTRPATVIGQAKNGGARARNACEVG